MTMNDVGGRLAGAVELVEEIDELRLGLVDAEPPHVERVRPGANGVLSRRGPGRCRGVAATRAAAPGAGRGGSATGDASPAGIDMRLPATRTFIFPAAFRPSISSPSRLSAAQAKPGAGRNAGPVDRRGPARAARAAGPEPVFDDDDAPARGARLLRGSLPLQIADHRRRSPRERVAPRRRAPFSCRGRSRAAPARSGGASPPTSLALPRSAPCAARPPASPSPAPAAARPAGGDAARPPAGRSRGATARARSTLASRPRFAEMSRAPDRPATPGSSR